MCVVNGIPRSTVDFFLYAKKNRIAIDNAWLIGQNAVDTPLGTKIPAMDSTKAYSHCWDFLLAEAGMPLITLKL